MAKPKTVERPEGWNCAECRWYEPVGNAPDWGECFGGSTHAGMRGTTYPDSWCGGFTVKKGERAMGKGD